MRTLFGRFIEHCRLQRNLSELTCVAYTSDFRRFRDWIVARSGGGPVQAHLVRPEDIQEYVAHMRRSGLRQNSILRRLNALSSFFDHLVKWHGLKVNPVRLVERGRRVRVKVRVPTRSQVAGALFHAHISCRPSHTAALMLAAYAGLRFSEILALTWDRVNLADGELVVLGKGRKERKVPILPCLHDRLSCLAAMSSPGGGAMPTGPVLRGRGGRPIGRKALRAILRLHGPDLHAQGFAWHSLRRWFATRLYRQGIGPVEIRELLGHEDIATTMAYIQPETEALKERLKGLKL